MSTTAQLAHLSPEEQRALLAQLLQKNAPKPKQVPASYAQERLWFLEQMDPGNPAHHMLFPVRLRGQLNVTALAHSLNEIVQRHETLRTTFAVDAAGKPVQIIAPAQTVPLPEINLQALSEAEWEARSRELAVEDEQRPFDLGQGPLLRATLLRWNDAEHVLLLNLHHIISDGWSMGVFIREMAALYQAYAAQHPSPLPPLPLQYADFAAWQRQRLQGEALQSQLAYWQNQLAGATTTIDLPLDQPAPHPPTYQAGIHYAWLPRDLSERLRALSRQEQVTPFMLLLAAFKTLLYRYSGSTDIVVGSAVANRNRAELEGLIGTFFNVLPLRVDLTGNPTFRALLDRVKQVTLGAYAHQELPLDKIVEVLHSDREGERPPLFQIVFNMMDGQPETIELPGLTLSVILTRPEATIPELMRLSTRDTAQGLLNTVTYRADLFSQDSIVRLLEHYRTLLESILVNPQQRLLDLPVLTAAEQQHVVADWNATKREYGEARRLHVLIEARTAQQPDALAVVFDPQDNPDLNHHLTYGELNARANHLARQLQRLGVGSDSLVGVYMVRSVEMVIALLGILKAGGAYVPLDPTYPRDRLSYMLATARVPVLLTQSWLAADLPDHQAQILCLDQSDQLQAIALNPPSPLANEELAYVIFTSGSTGQPKGVMNTQRAILNRLLWMQDAYHLTLDDRVLQKTPFSFDVSVWEFFWPLLTGATLVMAQPEGHKDSAYLVQTIRDQHISTLHFVPSMLQMFVREQDLEHCISLRRVVCSGEALPADIQPRVWERIPSATLYNLYGPTEAAVDVTAWTCDPHSPYQVVPIGRPIANLQIYLLDARFQPVPVGVPGELFIGGMGLARGYLHRPDLTAERFVPDPFSTESGTRLYRTGDLARYLPDGNIEFLGRLDFQVKIRGFRIELGEIEAALRQHPVIRDAVVVARQAESGDKRLVAYLAAEASALPSLADLRAWLGQRLPDYMLPASFVCLDHLPLSPSGKVDRKVLPHESAALEQPAEFIAPETDLEKRIAEIWMKALDLKQVGITDNFFELGGHSLIATQVIFEINQALQMKLSVRDLFQEPTIAGLSLLIEERLIEELEREENP
jgi:amino acid adenylation domain-containing protein